MVTRSWLCDWRKAFTPWPWKLSAKLNKSNSFSHQRDCFKFIDKEPKSSTSSWHWSEESQIKHVGASSVCRPLAWGLGRWPVQVQLQNPITWVTAEVLLSKAFNSGLLPGCQTWELTAPNLSWCSVICHNVSKHETKHIQLASMWLNKLCHPEHATNVYDFASRYANHSFILTLPSSSLV